MQQRNFRLFDRTNLTKTLICPRQISQTPLTNAIKHLELQKNMHKFKCAMRKKHTKYVCEFKGNKCNIGQKYKINTIYKEIYGKHNTENHNF